MQPIQKMAHFAGALLIAATTLGSVAHAQDGKRIALMVGPTQDAFIGTLSKTFEDKAKAGGTDVDTFSSPFDPALQARQIDDAIAQKFDLLAIMPISQQAIVPSLDKAKEAGIPVINIVSEMQGDAADMTVAYIGENSIELGRQAGIAVASALKAAGKESGRIAAITGSMAEGVAPLRLQGFKEALAENAPDATLVASEDVHWNPVDGEQAAGQLLARFAADGGLNAMYGMNDTLANAIIQAANTAGIAVGGDGMIVVGGNCQAPGVRNLMAGDMTATVLMLPTVSGAKAAEVALDVLAGKQVNRDYYEEHKVIDSGNIGEYAQACAY
jgi:ribose transport system substrate-binding protein